MSTKQSGITLIELLVVLVIMGIMMSLVGSFTVNMVDSAKARNEKLQLMRWLKAESFVSFNRSEAITYRLDGRAIYRHPPLFDERTGEELSELTFESLFFELQYLSYNQHGYSEPQEIHFYQGQHQDVINLQVLFEARNEQ